MSIHSSSMSQSMGHRVTRWRNSRRLFLSAVTLFLACSAIADAAPPAVFDAATNALLPLLTRITGDMREKCGLKKGERLENAALGRPFRLYCITPAAIENYRDGATVTSMLTPTTMWYFPVVVRGKTTAILVVDRIHNRWKAVSLGYASLAARLDEIMRQWPAAKGYAPRLIAVYQAHTYFINVPQIDDCNLTRLHFSGAGQRDAEVEESERAIPRPISNSIAFLKASIRGRRDNAGCQQLP